MTPEARLAFVLFFFAVWCFLGLIAWCIGAVISRGRGALPALPLALAGACAAGVAVPLAGLDDAWGLLISLTAAFIASALLSAIGIVLAQRAWPAHKAGPVSSAERRRVPEPDASGLTPDT
jgi:hypothetical protein